MTVDPRLQLRNVGLVTGGNLVSAGLGLGLLLLLARTLSPAELAIVAATIAIIDGGQLFLDTTFNPGTVSVATRRGDGGRPDAAILRAGFWAKVGGGLGFAAVAAAFAVPLSQGLVGDRALVGLIVLAGIGAALAGMQSFVLAILQAHGRFGRIAFATVWKNAIRIGVVAPFVLVAEPDALSAARAVCLATAATLAVSLPLVSWGFLRDRAPLRAGLGAIRNINGWMAVVAFSVLAGRLDLWLVGLLAGAHEAGLYALAAQLCVGVSVITQALVTTFLPTVSRLTDQREIERFIRRWLRCLPLALLAIALVWPVAGPGIRLVFGEAYAGSTWVFNVLFAGSLMTLVGAPLMLLLLAFGEARLLAVSSLLQVVLRVAIALPVVARGGAIAMALADVAARLLAMAFVGYFIWTALRRRRAEGSAAALAGGPDGG